MRAVFWMIISLKLYLHIDNNFIKRIAIHNTKTNIVFIHFQKG